MRKDTVACLKCKREFPFLIKKGVKCTCTNCENTWSV